MWLGVPSSVWHSSLGRLLLLLLLLVYSASGKLITCVCTTNDCVGNGARTCNTTSMCYTQYLVKNDGSNPLVRGCITNKTPLLCENRPPAGSSGKWPLLQCCNHNMCNEEGIPTIPPWHGTSKSSLEVLEAEGSRLEIPNPEGDDERGGGRGMLSPIYIGVLVVGACLLLVIGAVAMGVLRRQHNRFYGNEFGIDRRGYVKGSQCPPNDLPAAKKLNSDLENHNNHHMNGGGGGGLYNNKILST